MPLYPTELALCNSCRKGILRIVPRSNLEFLHYGAYTNCILCAKHCKYNFKHMGTKIPLSSGTRLVPLRYKKIEYIDHPVSFGGEYLTVASRINEKDVPNVFFPLHCGYVIPMLAFPNSDLHLKNPD